MYLHQYDTIELSKENIARCNNNSHFSAGDVIEEDAQSEYQRFFREFPKSDDMSEDQVVWLDERADSWKELVTSIYTKHVTGRANFVPVTVAGPARYNADKFEKIADRNIKNMAESQAKMERFIQNTRSGLIKRRPLEVTLQGLKRGKFHKEVITSDDPDAVVKLQAKLEHLEYQHQQMKDVNAHWRKHGTMAGFKGVADDEVSALDIKIKTDTIGKGKPYPAYCLSNSNGNMNSIRKRVHELLQKQEVAEFKQIDFDGGYVIGNKEVDRLQFIFDEKPDEETRKILKSSAFRWSSKNSAWQRQWTKNGELAVKFVLRELSKAEV